MIVKITIGNTYKIGNETVRVIRRSKKLSVSYDFRKKEEVVLVENIITRFRKVIPIKDFRLQAEPYHRGA